MEAQRNFLTFLRQATTRKKAVLIMMISIPFGTGFNIIQWSSRCRGDAFSLSLFFSLVFSSTVLLVFLFTSLSRKRSLGKGKT